MMAANGTVINPEQEVEEILKNNELDNSEKILTCVVKLLTESKELRETTRLHDLRLDVLEYDRDNTKAELAQLKAEIFVLKRSAKANNLIIHKFPDTRENNKNLKDNIMKFLISAHPDLKPEAISRVHRIGKLVGSRPILVCFINPNDKAAIFQNIDVIKENGLAISNDLLPEERKLRKHLLSFFQGLREKGLNPKIRDDKILINGKLFTGEEISKEFGVTPEPPRPPSGDTEKKVPATNPDNLQLKKPHPTVAEVLSQQNSPRGRGRKRLLEEVNQANKITKYVRTDNTGSDPPSPPSLNLQ